MTGTGCMLIGDMVVIGIEYFLAAAAVVNFLVGMLVRRLPRRHRAVLLVSAFFLALPLVWEIARYSLSR